MAPAEQRHTAHRIFERLRDERGFDGGYSTVRDYVRARRQVRKEVFVPLAHPPGHAQADFGEATAHLGGIEQEVRSLVMDSPQSDATFVKAYHAETTETFCAGHVDAFAFFGGMRARGLGDPLFVVSDGAPGIIMAIETCFPRSARQRCHPL